MLYQSGVLLSKEKWSSIYFSTKPSGLLLSIFSMDINSDMNFVPRIFGYSVENKDCIKPGIRQTSRCLQTLHDFQAFVVHDQDLSVLV